MTEKRNYLHDWILPTVTTFVGVFAAAYLTIWTENSREDEETRMVLEVALTDACSSLATVDTAVQRLRSQQDIQQALVMAEPKIMLSVLQRHAQFFAEFEPPIATELIRHLSTVEKDLQQYARSVGKGQTFARLAPIIDDDGGDATRIADNESARLFSSAQQSAEEAQHALQRLALLLDLQLSIMRGDLSAKQAEQSITTAQADSACR